MTELASRETKPDTVVRPFSEVTALVPEADDTFAAVIDPEWSIGGRANGGYLLALLGRAAALVVPDGHVVAASAFERAGFPVGRVEEVDAAWWGRAKSDQAVGAWYGHDYQHLDLD